MYSRARWLAPFLMSLTIISSIGISRTVKSAPSFQSETKRRTAQYLGEKRKHAPKKPDFNAIGEMLALDEVSLKRLQVMMKQHHELARQHHKERRKQARVEREAFDKRFKSELSELLSDEQIATLQSYLNKPRSQVPPHRIKSHRR